MPHTRTHTLPAGLPPLFAVSNENESLPTDPYRMLQGGKTRDLLADIGNAVSPWVGILGSATL